MQQTINTIKANKLIFILILCLFALFILFYPTKFVTIDEHDYINNAKLLVDGNLKTDCELNIPGQWNTGLGYCISKYNIGTSVFLVPAILLNENLVALTTFIVFISTALIFYRIIQYYKLDKRLIFLFLLFPPIVFFYRTALSEIYSMFILVAIFYLVLRFKYTLRFTILFAMLVGLGILVKYTNSIPIFVMLIYLLTKNGIKKLIPLMLLILVSVLGILLFNSFYYGNFLRSGYYFSSEQSAILISQILPVSIKYILILSIFYPFGFIIFLKQRVKHYFLILGIFLSLFIFHILFKNESFPGKQSDIILGLRFLIPVYPFFLLTYVSFLNKFKSHKYFNIVLYTLIVLLFLSNIVITYIHFNFINR